MTLTPDDVEPGFKLESGRTIGPEILKTTVDTYRKLRNSLRWMLGNLAHYQPEQRVAYADMPELERFILHRLWELDGAGVHRHNERCDCRRGRIGRAVRAGVDLLPAHDRRDQDPARRLALPLAPPTLRD